MRYIGLVTPGQPTLDADENQRLALEKLSEETRKLRELRELLALNVANQGRKKGLSEIAAQVERSQSELLELMIKVENFACEVIERRCKLNLPS